MDMNTPSALVAGLLSFAADQLGVEAPDVLPFFQKGPVPCTEVFCAEALYWPNIVIVAEPCDNRELKCQALMVHELVHHAQYHARLKYSCAIAREKPAYEAAVSYVEEFGVVDAYRYLGFGVEHLVYLKGRCDPWGY